MSGKKRRQSGRPALELIEEATHLLRSLPPRIFLSYYAGTLPFVFGFLYFWADMSRDAFAYEHVATASLSLAALFVWMKLLQSVFAVQMSVFIANRPTDRWSVKRVLRMLVVQTALQPTGLIALPIAALAVVPFGWVYAFYQNITVFDSGETGSVREACKNSVRQAMLYQGQNNILLSVLSLFGCFVLVNVLIVMFMAPHLLKTFFGIENVFTRAGVTMLNTTFFAAACAIVYVLIDPLLKAVYALRCFYGVSLHSGEDLMVELRSIQAERVTVAGMAVLCILLSTLVFAVPCKAIAAENPPVPRNSSSLSEDRLENSIKAELEKKEYSWRMPREKPPKKEQKGWFESFVDEVFDTVKIGIEKIFKGLGSLIEWIIKQLGKLLTFKDRGESSNVGWTKSANYLLIALVCVVACILAVSVWRMLKNRHVPKAEEAGISEDIMRDITGDDVSAEKLPVDKWLELAGDFMREGNKRLALRALYLACLAHLSHKGMINLARFKSNRDYERELKRKAGDMPELLLSFSANRDIFDNIWYGMHEVTDSLVEDFRANQERIMRVGNG